MNEQVKQRIKARKPHGFRDRDEADIAAERRMLDTIRRVYESYGFSALETPAFEYTDALGKFLPDSDRPNEGVFSLKDEDEQWLSLRYDLTAPLARYVAENFQNLPKPFRRYQLGQVWRNEKPGPGRYREFTQFDADTVGSASPAVDAELLMMFADSLDALGLKRGDYVIKFNSRKILDGVLDAADVEPVAARHCASRHGQVRSAWHQGRHRSPGCRSQGRVRRLHQGRAALAQVRSTSIAAFTQLSASAGDWQTHRRELSKICMRIDDLGRRPAARH